MDEVLKRFIKRNNKKKGLNITIATMVMFLLNCSGVYAENSEGDNPIINNEKLISSEGHAVNIENKYEVKLTDLENNGEIQGIRVASTESSDILPAHQIAEINNLTEVSYSLEDRHNDEYRVTSNREIIFEINPEVRAETEFLLQKMRINTYGTVSYEMNKYLLNNAPKMDIHDISTTSGVAERGAVTKIGTDIKIQNIGLGLELKYFSGEYNAEKVTGTVKASYKF